MNALIACSRLYNASPLHTEAWHALFEETGRLAGVRLQTELWAAPANIEELWRRPDLGLVFICGRPWLQMGARHHIIGAPLSGRHHRHSAYRTLLLARAADGLRALADSFGARLGHLPPHSQSGFNAPRYALSAWYRGRPLFRDTVELGTPGECLRALRQGRVDVAPVDSYFYRLYGAAHPDFARETVVLHRTPPTRMPFLAASPGLDARLVRALRTALQAGVKARGDIRATLRLNGFDLPAPGEYAALARQEAAALRRGYAFPQ